MIWFRADGGKDIGTGHVMRCLSIADALRQMGEQTCFLMADDSAVPLLERQGQEYRILDSSYLHPEEELEILLPLLAESPDSVFLADSYYVTEAYLHRIRVHMPVCYMDDRGISGLPVDLLINYNIFADISLYTCPAGEETKYQLETEYLLGTEYAPLRREFQQVNYQVRDQVNRVLLTTGGSDKYNLAGKILEESLGKSDIGNLEYWVISGSYNEYLPALLEIGKKYPRVHVFSNVTNMSQLMRDCDIAVTAGGSTMYELSAVGVPIICFSFVDNQEKIVQGFRNRNIVCFGGDYLRQGERMVRDVADHIGLLCEDTGLRRSYSSRQKALVDGQGAMRIAQRLCRLRTADGDNAKGRHHF